MEMDKNANNETSRQEEDFDLDQLINDFSDPDDNDKDEDSLEPLPLDDLLDEDVEEPEEEERITELDEESGGDYATLAREFVNLDIPVDEDEDEKDNSDSVIDLYDTIEDNAEDEDVHIDLNLSDITANTSEFEALQYSGEEDGATGLHVEMIDDMDTDENETVSDVPTPDEPVQAFASDEQDDHQEEEEMEEPTGSDGVTLEGSLEDIELEDYASESDGGGGESSFSAMAEADDDGIIDLDLDFGDDDEPVTSDPIPEAREDEEASTSDFLGLSSLSLFSSGASAESEVMFNGVEMDFEDQVRSVTRAEILLAVGKKDDAVTLFREISGKKGETNWVAKRLRMLAS